MATETRVAARATAAALLVRCLENEGVPFVFGIPGEENIRLIQALADSEIRYVLTRHEQAASFRAEVYGRVTGRAGVVSATLGPGAINLQLGVADATTNSTPVVALSAQVGHDRKYKESHQFIDLVNLFGPITQWSASVPSAAAIPEMVRKAFKIAETERPGAVYLAIPEDIDAGEADPALEPLPRNVPRAEAPAPGQIERASSWGPPADVRGSSIEHQRPGPGASLATVRLRVAYGAQHLGTVPS